MGATVAPPEAGRAVRPEASVGVAGDGAPGGAGVRGVTYLPEHQSLLSAAKQALAMLDGSIARQIAVLNAEAVQQVHAQKFDAASELRRQARELEASINRDLVRDTLRDAIWGEEWRLRREGGAS